MSDVLEETEEAVDEQLDAAAEENGEEQTEIPAVQEISEEPLEELHELSKPSVIDLKALLHPISGENPSGESIRYSGVYDEIKEARRQDEDLAQGEWQTELKLADFRKVIDIAVPVLETETKDIQIVAWLAEALTSQHGFAGLRDSLKLASRMQKKFWETLYPEIDEGDMEGRANALAWLDKETGLLISQSPITETAGYGLSDYEKIRTLTVPENYESLVAEERDKYVELLRRIDSENLVTQEKWDIEISKSKRAFYEELNIVIEECLEEYKNLNLVIEEVYDINQAPNLPNIKKSLEDIKVQTDKLLEQKREEEPDEIETTTAVVEGEDGVASVKGGVATADGAISSRADALKRLGDIANYFRKTEPHSPVAYLVTRAVKWGKMPLDTWLEDVIKDQNVLSDLREILGFNTGADEEGAEDAQ